MFTRDELKTFFCCSLSVLLPFHFFSPAFLCRCGDQPTSAFFFFFKAVEFETKAKYTGPFIKLNHGEERVDEKR